MADGLSRALIDTNVWVSAFINTGGAPARVLGAFLEGQFVPIISQSLLTEIRDVLDRPRIRRRYRFSDDDILTVLAILRDRAIEVVPSGNLRLCRDRQDDFLLESAILGEAQFVVSGDADLRSDLHLAIQLREHGIEVLSVTQFLQRLATEAT